MQLILLYFYAFYELNLKEREESYGIEIKI